MIGSPEQKNIDAHFRGWTTIQFLSWRMRVRCPKFGTPVVIKRGWEMPYNLRFEWENHL